MSEQEIIELSDNDYMAHLYMNAHDIYGDCDYKIEKYVEDWLKQEWCEKTKSWIVQKNMSKENKEMLKKHHKDQL